LSTAERALIEGNPVLVVIDIQGGDSAEGGSSAIPFMTDYQDYMDRHRRDCIDFGRELDGAEGIHLLEGDPGTEIDPALGMRDDDYFIRKRRYSCFFGTEFEILLKGLKANTLILIGGHTDVCVHYTFVDAHQNDYFCRVVEDCVAGSSQQAHDAALNAMQYLQSAARCNSAQITTAFEQFAAG